MLAAGCQAAPPRRDQNALPACPSPRPAYRFLQGIAEVDAQYAGQETVHFTDRLLFLVARKPATGSSSSGSSSSSSGSLPAPQLSVGQQEEQQQQQATAAGPGLTPEQRQQYAEQGFTGPVAVLSGGEAAELHQRYLQYARQLPGGCVSGDWRFKSHLLLPWVWELARHPRLLAAVSDALGGCRNLLLWSTDWFEKQPGDGGFTGWHQARGWLAGWRLLWRLGQGAVLACRPPPVWPCTGMHGSLTLLCSSLPCPPFSISRGCAATG